MAIFCKKTAERLTHICTKNCSALSSFRISGRDTLPLNLGEVLHLLGIKRGKREGIRVILFPELGENGLFKANYRRSINQRKVIWHRSHFI